jgi:hypothetical protein
MSVQRKVNLKRNKRKYVVGDKVGVCTDCMTEFIITGYKKGGYKAKCLRIHHPDPSKSVTKLNEEYFLKDSQIVMKLKFNW